MNKLGSDKLRKRGQMGGRFECKTIRIVEEMRRGRGDGREFRNEAWRGRGDIWGRDYSQRGNAKGRPVMVLKRD